MLSPLVFAILFSTLVCVYKIHSLGVRGREQRKETGVPRDTISVWQETKRLVAQLRWASSIQEACFQEVTDSGSYTLAKELTALGGSDSVTVLSLSYLMPLSGCTMTAPAPGVIN